MALNANTTLIYSASQGGKALLRFTGTSANVIVSANSTVNADISDANHLNDQISGAMITGVWWSCAGNSTAVGTISVARANSSVTNTGLILSGTGDWSRDDGWQGGRDFPSQNVVVTFTAAATGTLYLELYKQYPGGDGLIEHQ